MAREVQQSVHTNVIWRQAWGALVDQKWMTFCILTFFLFVPQLVSEWILASSFSETISMLKSLSAASELNVMHIMQSLSSGMMFLLFVLFLNFLFFCMAYIILVNCTVLHLKSQPVPPLKSQFRSTLKRLPKTSFILFFIFFIYLMIQATLPPLILLVSPIIMGPVLFLVEKRRLWSALADASTLKYLRKSGLPKISVYFILLGYIGFLILAIYLGVWVSDFILNFDVWAPIGFDFVNKPIFGTPFSAAHLLFELFFVFIFGYAIAFFVQLKVCFYYFTKNMHKRLPKDGVAA
jgi:hypothetical protein